MKNTQIILLVAGVGLVTFILSVVFSMNMVSIQPKKISRGCEKRPSDFYGSF